MTAAFRALCALFLAAEAGMGEQDGPVSASGGIAVEGSAEWVIESSHVGDRLRVCLFEPVPPVDEPMPLMVLVDGAGMMQTAAIERAGGAILAPISDIPVGRVAVVADPFGNVLVLVDLSKGRYITNTEGEVTDVKRA